MWRYLSAGIIIAYVLLLVFLSLNPWALPDPSQAIGFITWDLLDHAGAYGLLAILLLTGIKWRRRQFMIMLMTVLASGGLGIFLEFAQLWLTSTRSFSWFDAGANVFGAVIGSISFCIFVRIIAWGKRLMGLRLKPYTH